ncbi:MAG: GatB/YqeY domain-containing protein [Candidatus Azambacteria bacterium]|nr:GatB/YqeY domain-containing protein [Candidatus Azambacteria bacterium]
MTLYEKILADFKDAFKSGDTVTRGTLAMLKAVMQNKAIEKGEKDTPPTDEEVMDSIGSEVKKRRDSVTQFRAAERNELADKEEQELTVLMRYLPVQLTEEELSPLIVDAITKVGAVNEKDMGKVLGVLSGALKGRSDMALVAQIVRRKLLG